MQEYVVGFRVFDGRSLQSEDGGLCDPFVEVSCCGHVFYTETLENRATSSLVPWNEGCIWPSILLSPKEFESAVIEFRVYAKYWWTRNYLIGKASLQLQFVNKRKRHVYARRWICLRPEDSPTCTGMLNVTVYALQPGEPVPSSTEQVELMEEPAEDAENADDAEDLSKAVLKSTVDTPDGNPHHVHITISRVEDLVDLGGFGGPPSPYVTVEFAGCLIATATASRVKVFTFNEEIILPVITPIFEDTITVKLWSSHLLSPDELLAQGLLSFSELRNNALPPRWFNLYGWNTDEVPDAAGMAAMGSDPDPNYFKGRLLMSGRVERLKDFSQLQKATRQPSRPAIEPSMIMLALLGDVYMVTGAEGRNCRVELSFGSLHKSTDMVSFDAGPASTAMGSSEGGADAQGQEDDDNGEDPETEEPFNHFSFGERAGRVDPLLVMAPEDPLSQPYLMVNIYTDGYLQRYQRIAYAKCHLSEFPQYEQGNPSRPRFIALESMPNRKNNRNPPSILITIEKHTSDDVVRHLRRKVKPMFYIVRAYIFMGRHLRYDGMRTDSEPDYYGIRVACAGMSKTTKFLQGPRPLWMHPMDLKVILCSDSPKEPPTIEPISVTLVTGSYVSSDLGKAVCVYTHMRQRDNLMNWEPYSLDPQWIRVFGGPYGADPVGEVLIGFELLLWKHRDELKLQCREMWPQPEDNFDRTEHLCCLRKATLHFSMNGLRDLEPLPNVESLGFASGWTHVARPMVTVGVRSFSKDQNEGGELTFHYQEVKPGGDERVQVDRLRTWHSKIGPSGEGANFEFLQVGTLKVLIPDSSLFQPYVSIKVWDKPSEGGLAGALGYTPTPIGESLQSLNPVLPCIWLDGVTTDKSYEEQKPLIAEKLALSRSGGTTRDHFKELTPEEMRLHLARLKEAMTRVSLKVSIIGAAGLNEVSIFDKVEPYCTCEIDGKRSSRVKTTPIGDKSTVVWNYETKINDYRLDDALLFCLFDRKDVNMERALARATLIADQIYPHGFDGQIPFVIAAEGQISLQVKVVVADDGTIRKSFITPQRDDHDFLNSEALPEPLRKQSDSKRRVKLMPIEAVNVRSAESFSPRNGVEVKPFSGENRGTLKCKLENSEERPFVHDFWYKNMPLLRNHDIVSENDNEVDWSFQPGVVFGFVKCTFKLVDGWESQDEVVDTVGEEMDENEDEDDPVETTDAAKLRRSFEFDPHLDAFAFDQSKLHMHYKKPSRVPPRVRVRLYFVKAVCIVGAGGNFANPYLSFHLGRTTHVSIKNMVRLDTNTPDFYHFEERDIQLPYDGRIEVSLMDMDELTMTGDNLIGSTVIDLEERWHSRRWKYFNKLQIVPIESRPLFDSQIRGKVRGSLEMWVEMIETTQSSDIKPSDIRKPPDLEMEVRFVIWGATGVPAVKDEYTNVKISTMLDCKEYHGDCDKVQETDVHFNSRDGRAVFGWRIVYPGIQMPVFSCAVQFNLYHYELLAGDTFIGSFNLDLKKYLERSSKDMMARELGPADLKFTPEDTSEAEDFNAAVSVSLYVLTQMEASARAQGLGRNDPNDHPQLITPTEGREWGDYLSTFGIGWPDFGLWKKLIPLVVAAGAFLVSLIVVKQLGLI